MRTISRITLYRDMASCTPADQESFWSSFLHHLWVIGEAAMRLASASRRVDEDEGEEEAGLHTG